MPAIQIERLNQQITNIFAHSSDPEIFIDNIKELMEVHANLAYRAGMDLQNKEELFSYHLAPIVMQQLRFAFIQFAQNEPENSIKIAEILWNQDILEMKEFVAIIFGNLPETASDSALKKLQKWGEVRNPRKAMHILFDTGTHTIRRHQLGAWIEVIRKWLESNVLTNIQHGLIALLVLAEDREYEDIPKIFSMTAPLLERREDSVRAGLLQIYSVLAKRSPVETAFFLRHNLLSSGEKDMSRFIRRCIPAFPPEQQKMLKEVLSS